MTFAAYFWGRQPAIDAFLLKRFARFIGPDKLVVDVGAGYAPWPHATEIVDMTRWPEMGDDQKLKIVDVESERLPYEDKEVDFLYCRHTLEDLSCPFLLCSEINRVAKAGYIETPSPIAEFCQHVDAFKLGARGFIHHRWFIWDDGGTLTFLPKFPLIERIAIKPEIDARAIEMLQGVPATWNTFLLWEDAFPYRHLRHPVDFDLRTNYFDTIRDGMNLVAGNTLRFLEEGGLVDAEFVGCLANGHRVQ